MLTPEALGVDVTPRIKTLKVVEPPKRSAGIKVPDVATLIAKLKNDIQTGAYPSMVSDVLQGRLTEVDQLNGEIVALGQRHGLPTPINAKLVELVQSLAGRKAPPLLTPDDLAKTLRV